MNELIKKRKRGRPKKNKEDYIIKAIEYYNLFDELDIKLNLAKTKQVLPTIEGLALYLNTYIEEIYRYKNENKDFCKIVNKIITKQISMLINLGLIQSFNKGMVSLLLSRHGYYDKTEVNLTTENKEKIDKVLDNINDILNNKKE